MVWVEVCHCELKAKQSLVNSTARLFASKSHKKGFYRSKNPLLTIKNEIASCLAMTNAEIASSFLQGCAPTNVNAVTRSRWL